MHIYLWTALRIGDLRVKDLRLEDVGMGCLGLRVALKSYLVKREE